MTQSNRMEFRIDEYTEGMLEEILSSKKFTSKASIIRTAIHKFYNEQSHVKAPGGIGTPDIQHLNTISKNPMISPFPTC